MKILANDGIHSAAQAKLEELGHQVFTEHIEQKDLAVWINENLHSTLKRSCKQERPKIHLGDRVEVLIEKGLQFERLGLSLRPEGCLK